MPEAQAGVCLDGGVLKVWGALDAQGVLMVRGQGESFIRSGSGPLTVDLADSPDAHSAALSLFLCWQRCAQSQHRPLHFINVAESICSLASLSGVHHFLSGFAGEGH
ncbi:STAS domain-containing protein [Marinobacter zhejiangensis]|uniref:Phospholipid transport system transporter-binding protein n=1 Tax=Marinobacter zhejiangensis TaxID=488535 RepID=A0A1I4QNI9_9GAMM|nr:phospholipid transport system transporter-binding protein [Marinobacter zhejiangensis]